MKYRIMICDYFESIDADSEEDAKEKVLERIKLGEIDFAIIAWCEE